MATSQNGWTVHTSSSGLAPLSWITGRVRPGDVHAIFDDLCRRFHNEVEPIIVGHSWGWAYRAVRGQTSGFSNHASGTAIDLNAPAHPIGKWNTFSEANQAKIRAIVRSYDGAIRWGGDYQNRPDDMHFEINTSAEHLARVVAGLGTNQQEDYMSTSEGKAHLDRIENKIDKLTEMLGNFRKNEFQRDMNEIKRDLKRYQELKKGQK